MNRLAKHLALLSASFLLASCGFSPEIGQVDNDDAIAVTENDGIKEIYRLYQAAGGALTYEEWLSSIKGDDGTTLLSGGGAPSNSQGKDGDSYIDNVSWNFYVKSNGAWNKLGCLKGEQGEQGERGDQGQKGEKGEEALDGKSAYEVYKEAHPEYLGDEAQWIDDLVHGRLAEAEVTTYTVTFDLGYDELSFTQEVEDGKLAAKPEDPTRDGYSFLGWFDENRDLWNFEMYTITSDITLFASWGR